MTLFCILYSVDMQIRCADDSYTTPKYCGLIVPTTIFITNCNQVLIQFRSDGSTVDTGFSLQYFVTDNGGLLMQNDKLPYVLRMDIVTRSLPALCMAINVL